MLLFEPAPEEPPDVTEPPLGGVDGGPEAAGLVGGGLDTNMTALLVLFSTGGGGGMMAGGGGNCGCGWHGDTAGGSIGDVASWWI